MENGPKMVPQKGGLDGRDFSAAAGWNDIVKHALDEKVDLVLLAGDVVDWENRYFEAYGPLEKGVRRLVEAGIAVWAVAGNHDVEALPKLAKAMEGSGFRLLGRGGKWERAVLEQDGAAVLCVDGWSFRERFEKIPPLTSYVGQRMAGVPSLVMLHGDLDQGKSVYAPVSRSDMTRIGADFWLLGHIHKPMLDSLPGGAPILYPGSPMALDPGEAGVHGPWVLEVEGGNLQAPRQMPLSRMRYESIELDVSGKDDVDTFDTWILPELKRRTAELLADHRAARCLSLRTVLTGRTPLHGLLPERASRLMDDLDLEVDGVPVRLDKMACDTLPDYDLVDLARGASPVALLARLLVDLESGSAAGGSSPLLEVATKRLGGVMTARPFQALGDESRGVGGEESALLLRRAGLRLLERLMAQQEAP